MLRIIIINVLYNVSVHQVGHSPSHTRMHGQQNMTILSSCLEAEFSSHVEEFLMLQEEILVVEISCI